MVGILSLKGDRKEQMGVMGQGFVLMVFGMTVVYLFLWLMIVVVKHSSRFVVKFCVSNKVVLEDDPTNFVLMQAMGPNVSGVIGSAVVAGILYTLCR